jgi:mRNA-degrading endonuclease RelE of RelBE toxin-antitoxin system
MACVVVASPSFARIVKKLHAKDKLMLDQAIQQVASNPHLGEEKRGDLSDVFVYKFKLRQQVMLLAYQLSPNKNQPERVELLAVGPHENFYTQLKRK